MLSVRSPSAFMESPIKFAHLNILRSIRFENGIARPPIKPKFHRKMCFGFTPSDNRIKPNLVEFWGSFHCLSCTLYTSDAPAKQAYATGGRERNNMANTAKTQTERAEQ